jgi:hypothetical protein
MDFLVAYTLLQLARMLKDKYEIISMLGSMSMIYEKKL